MERSNIKILVVDDVPDNVKILLSILKEEGVIRRQLPWPVGVN